jgi:hypothetical protein
MNAINTNTNTTATAMTTTTATAELATIGQECSLSWATKGGQVKTAFSAVGAALAPRAARITAAQTATVNQLKNGQFRPFIRDVVAAFAGGKLAGLRAAVTTALTITTPEGVVMVPAGDAFATMNKTILTAVGEWLQSPINGKGETFTLTKAQDVYAAVWFAYKMTSEQTAEQATV